MMNSTLKFAVVIGGAIAFILGLYLVAYIFLAARSTSREASHVEVCESKLHALSDVLVHYRDNNGDLPEDFVSPEGHAHSWRVLLLPQLLPWLDDDGDEIDAIRYHVDEPWNSEHNRKYAGRYFRHPFRCNIDGPPERQTVTYVWLRRRGGEDASSTPLSDKAVMIVESSNSDIEFGEPGDLEMATLWEGESPFGAGKLNSCHPRYVRAIRFDGKVIKIPKNIGRERLRHLLNGE